MTEKLSETQLEAILAQQIELAKHDRKAGGREASHKKALDYYFGDMDAYVPPEENRSKVVSTDVRDVISWLMPQLLRVFTAARSMFVAEPREEDDVHYAEDVTDGLNYIFWDENNGYETVHSGTWDSLLHGDAIVKTFYDETPVYSAAKYHEALTDDERAMLVGDDDTEVLAQTENASQVPGPPTMDPTNPMQMVPGPMVDQTTYDLKVRHKKANGRYVVTVIPPEDFLIDADATSLEDAAFKSHWQHKTRSDLVAMGYDKDKVWAIPEATRNETAAQQARNQFISADATDKSMQIVDYHECYVMVDADGDGEAELIRACYAGGSKGSLLDWEVWEDEDPFDNIRCKPIPHRWDSGSIADDEIEIQDVKTVLKRQYLNNTYWVNNPQMVVVGSVTNPESLTAPDFGTPIMAKSGTTVTPLVREYIGDKALAGIHYMDEETAKRTGVNSQSMALDPETLQNQSATANQNATDASRSQPEMIARNMAEGWARVGRKLNRLMAKHEDGPRTIMAKGKPRPIDARTWNPDMHVKVNTGLGTGSRDRDATMLNTVLQQQIAFTDRIGMAFPEKALDMLPYIHATLTKFAESTGLQNPEMYWPDIDPEEIKAGKVRLAQPKPNPKLEEIQAQAAADKELKQVDANLAVEQAKIKAQGDVVKNQAELDADLQTAAADRANALTLAQQKAQDDYNLMLEKTASAERIKLAELTFETHKLDTTTALEREKMAHAQTLAAMKPQPQPGKGAN